MRETREFDDSDTGSYRRNIYHQDLFAGINRLHSSIHYLFDVWPNERIQKKYEIKSEKFTSLNVHQNTSGLTTTK